MGQLVESDTAELESEDGNHHFTFEVRGLHVGECVGLVVDVCGRIIDASSCSPASSSHRSGSARDPSSSTRRKTTLAPLVFTTLPGIASSGT